MLCGSPQLLADPEALLQARLRGRRGRLPGDYVLEKAFVR
jgi:hypothetical protein